MATPRHHRTDDAEPFLAGRRVWNFIIETVAHRFPVCLPSPEPAIFLCERM
jgi:hypothetical protein